MPSSIQNPHPRRIRAALQLRSVPVTIRQIALKHEASEKTVHAVLAGTRPGKEAKVRAAVAEIRRLVKGVRL